MKCFRCTSWPCTCKDGQTIIHGDCREVLPELGTFDLVLTDPPYPDWLAEEFIFCEKTIEIVLSFCKSFICFWTAKQPFMANYDRTHIWDKKTGCGSQYERIFEREHGDKNWCVFSYYLVNSTVAASFTGDVFYKHKAQKPLRLIRALLQRGESETILDPFLGSGTTLRACKDLGRRGTGIEIEERYCEIAANRLKQEVLF